MQLNQRQAHVVRKVGEIGVYVVASVAAALLAAGSVALGAWLASEWLR